MWPTRSIAKPLQQQVPAVWLPLMQKGGSPNKNIPLMFKGFVFILLLGLIQAHGLERRPWLYPPYQFHAGAAIEGWWFSSVDHGFNPIDYGSNNVLVQGYLVVPFAPMWEAEVEVELERTSKRHFGFESVVLEV